MKDVKPVSGYTVHIWFTNGTERDIDLEKYLQGPVFEKVRRDSKYFESIHVTEGRTIGWDDDLDIDPDTLYHELVPAWQENAGPELVA